MPLGTYVQRYGNALSPNMVDFMRVRSKAGVKIPNHHFDCSILYF